MIDLELCKLGYKLTSNCLPVNLLASLKGDATGKTLTKTHGYNTRYKGELNPPKALSKNYCKASYFKVLRNILHYPKS